MTKKDDNIINMFSDSTLVEFLEEALDNAKKGLLTHAVAIMGNKEDTSFTIIGLETMRDVTEMIGNLELMKTQLTLNLMEDIGE